MAIAPTNYVNQVEIDNITYDIAASYLKTGNNFYDWDDISSLIQTGFKIIVSTDADSTPLGVTWKNSQGQTIVGTLSPDQTIQPPGTHGDPKAMYLVPDEDQFSGNYIEYVIAGTGAAANWEKIGTTKADLSGYLKKGVKYTGSVFGTANYLKANDVTANGGAHTVPGASFTVATTTAAHSHGFVPEGTVNMTYTAASTITISEVTGANFTTTPAFNGTKATLTFVPTTGTATFTGTFTPSGSITGSYPMPAHSHSIGKTDATVVASIGSATTSVLNAATVTNGVLSFDMTTAVASISSTNTTVVGSIDANTENKSAGDVSFTPAIFNGTPGTVSVSGTVVTGIADLEYTPEGSLSNLGITLTATNVTVAIEGIKSPSATFSGKTNGTTADANTTIPTGALTGSHNIPEHNHGIGHTNGVGDVTADLNVAV